MRKRSRSGYNGQEKKTPILVLIFLIPICVGHILLPTCITVILPHNCDRDIPVLAKSPAAG